MTSAISPSELHSECALISPRQLYVTYSPSLAFLLLALLFPRASEKEEKERKKRNWSQGLNLLLDLPKQQDLLLMGRHVILRSLEVSSLCNVSTVVRKHKLCGVMGGGVAAAPLTVNCSL